MVIETQETLEKSELLQSSEKPRQNQGILLIYLGGSRNHRMKLCLREY